MKRQLLSTWNQVAPRGYIRKCYCFPYQPTLDLEALRKHLSSALHQLARHVPHLSGRISLLPKPLGHLCIDIENGANIPLHIFDQRATFCLTYAQLKAEGFPARAFVNKDFDLPYHLSEDQQGVPVFEVHARVIEGGLLLCAYYHHSTSDGSNMDNYISSFADLTRDPTHGLDLQHPADIHLDLPQEAIGSSQGQPITGTFDELLQFCPNPRQII